MAFKRLFRLSLAFAALSTLTSCNDLSHPSGAKAQQQSQPLQVPVMPSNRFQLVTAAEAHLALDTQTGQVCKTHDWQRLADPTVPLCFDLYKQFPSVGKLQEVKIWDRDSSGKVVEKGVSHEFVIPLEQEASATEGITVERDANGRIIKVH